MLTALEIVRAVTFSVMGHANFARSPENRVRKWDEATPYGVHPVWCAMTILFETTLPLDVRVNGFLVLLFHDLLEDTHVELSEGTPPEVVRDVRAMTNDSDAVEEDEERIRELHPRIQLYRLYDKTCNWMDGVPRWDEEKHSRRRGLLLLRAELVEKRWGTLNIVRIARGLCL